mgnify:CR=1 FL=1
MKILFRTSGGSVANKELGTGHIFRTINLSKQFKGHKKIFLVEDYGGVKKILQDNNISNTKFLKPNLSIKEDYEKTLKIIKEEKIDLIISLVVPRQIIEKRIIGRVTCDKCNLTLNEFFNKEEIDLHPCGKEYFIKRKDDNLETIMARYDIYTKTTEPVLNFLSKNLNLFGYNTFIWSCAKFFNKKDSIYSLIKFREKYFIKNTSNNHYPSKDSNQRYDKNRNARAIKKLNNNNANNS